MIKLNFCFEYLVGYIEWTINTQRYTQIDMDDPMSFHITNSSIKSWYWNKQFFFNHLLISESLAEKLEKVYLVIC